MKKGKKSYLAYRRIEVREVCRSNHCCISSRVRVLERVSCSYHHILTATPPSQMSPSICLLDLSHTHTQTHFYPHPHFSCVHLPHFVHPIMHCSSFTITIIFLFTIARPIRAGFCVYGSTDYPGPLTTTLLQALLPLPTGIPFTDTNQTNTGLTHSATISSSLLSAREPPRQRLRDVGYRMEFKCNVTFSNLLYCSRAVLRMHLGNLSGCCTVWMYAGNRSH